MKNNFTPVPQELCEIKRINELSVKPITETFNEKYERIIGHEINVKTCDIGTADEIVRFIMEECK